jgi:hypothetical protein
VYKGDNRVNDIKSHGAREAAFFVMLVSVLGRSATKRCLSSRQVTRGYVCIC